MWEHYGKHQIAKK